MEADWEFEIGGDAPVIDAAWDGYVDLRSHPNRVREIAETRQLPPLADTLLRLNAPGSPLATSKCDVWQPDAFDAYELDARPEEAKQALACYVDLLPRSGQQWAAPERVADCCRAWTARLQAVSLSSCRADFIVRRAWITSTRESFGVTAYLTACGKTVHAAQAAMTAALSALADAILLPQSSEDSTSKYNGSSPGE